MNKKKLTVLLSILCPVLAVYAEDNLLTTNYSILSDSTVRRMGQNPDIAKEFELNPVVVTGTGTHQRLKNTTAPVAVVTANEIKRAGITDFQQAMTMMVPSLSFNPTSMGAYLTMNGLSNKYVLILVNGHKLIGDVSNNIDLDRIDMSRIKRIEVLNGAASSLYGSDAIAGVINIITNDPQDEITLTSSTKYSGKGQLTQSVNLDIAKGKIGSSTAFKHAQADNWQNSPYETVTAKDGTTSLRETVYPMSFGFHSNMLNQKFTLQATEELSFYASGNYYWKLTDRPPKTNDTNGGFNYDIHHESWRFEAGGLYRINSKNSIKLDLTADDFQQRHKFITDYQDYSIGDYSLTKKQKLYNAELRGIFHFTTNSNTVFGLNAREDKLKATSGDVDASAYTLSAYAQHEMKWNAFKATFGARYDYHELAGSHFSPKATLMYTTGGLNLRATYAHGFISPQLSELYYKYYNDNAGRKPTVSIGNKDLKPGKSNYFSLNAEYRTNRYSIAVTGYLNYLNDMITRRLYPINDEIKDWLRKNLQLTQEQIDCLEDYNLYVNFDKAIIRGIQVDASANLFPGFVVTGNYSYTYSRGRLDGVWQNIERSIRHTGTVAVNYSHSWGYYRLNVNLNGRLQSKRYFPGEDDAPGYGIWNINTRHTFDHIRHIQIEPSIGIDNIFNKKDVRPKGVNYALLSPGRMLTIGLNIKFN